MKDKTEANDKFRSSVGTFSFILIFRSKILVKSELLRKEVIQLQCFIYGEVPSSYFFDNFCTSLFQKWWNKLLFFST